MVGLNGALSNPRVQLELLELAARRDSLLGRLRKAPRRFTAAPAKPCRILQAVTTVLAASDQPVRAREIHQAAESLLGRPIRWASVRAALSAYTIGGDNRFERPSYGAYVLKGSLD
jgi:hypothetical protein